MRKTFLILSVLLIVLGGILIYQNIKFADKKLHVSFCDVGQGDAILMRTPSSLDILIDGGPNDKVLSCLANHMPFWDRTIELMILTHPDADHITGLIDVVKRYSITHFYTSEVATETAVYKGFLKALEDRKIKQNYIWQGDKIILKDGLIIETLWPTREWNGQATNSFSVANLLTYKNFKILLPGDLDSEQMEQLDDLAGKVNVLKVPHHGSRFGLNSSILDILSPEMAVISVGKNSYGHPTQFVLQLLKDKNIKILRTDLPANALRGQVQAGQGGEVEVVSDGNIWKVN